MHRDATIVVIDDGHGLDQDGLRRHWLIGDSNKRKLTELPRGRQQIGKFGIGKLSTYVLANRLTHTSKIGTKYYSTSMNYHVIDKRGDVEVEPKSPIKIALRELTAEQAKEDVTFSGWSPQPSKRPICLFLETIARSLGRLASCQISRTSHTRSNLEGSGGSCARHCHCGPILAYG